MSKQERPDLEYIEHGITHVKESGSFMTKYTFLEDPKEALSDSRSHISLEKKLNRTGMKFITTNSIRKISMEEQDYWRGPAHCTGKHKTSRGRSMGFQSAQIYRSGRFRV